MEQTINSTRFGDLSFDPAYDWYEAQIDFDGQSIKLRLSAPTEVEAVPMLANAETMAADEAGWLARLKDKAADDLLDISNEWNEDQDDWTGPIDSAAFIARITLKSLVFHEDDLFQAYFDDGDLFWGHSILVRGSMAEGPKGAETAG